ncbi:MAG: hypothetical protein L3J03_06335 [Desulfobacterales bacterium]|nr:hypothetical protein [Desulfobacterales bacterium]
MKVVPDKARCPERFSLFVVAAAKKLWSSHAGYSKKGIRNNSCELKASHANIGLRTMKTRATSAGYKTRNNYNNTAGIRLSDGQMIVPAFSLTTSSVADYNYIV